MTALRIHIVDDDSERQEFVKDEVLEVIPTASIDSFSDLLSSARKSEKVDVLIIDISAVTPIMLWHRAYRPICFWLEKHPGATIILNSACSGLGLIREGILERIPDADVRHVDWGRVGLLDLLKQIV